MKVLLGVVLRSSGVSAHLGLSPVVTCAVAGALSANGSTEREAFHDLLLRIEKPLYLLMLDFAGAIMMWARGRTIGPMSGALALGRRPPWPWP